MISSSDTVAEAEVEQFSNPPWFKALLKKFHAPRNIPDTPEKREAFRLQLDLMETLSLQITLENGVQIDTVISDLSAGGFSALFTAPLSLRKGKPLRIAFTLPFEAPLVINTEAFPVHQRVDKDGKIQILSFEFSPHLDEESRDRIHQFLIRKQFDLLKNNGRSRRGEKVPIPSY